MKFIWMGVFCSMFIYIFHFAWSGFCLVIRKPSVHASFCTFQAELIEPAVKGTLNVLRSCRKVPLIKRVVVTSSIATVIYNRNPLNPDVVVDETWFSDPVFCEETKVCLYILYLMKKKYILSLAWGNYFLAFDFKAKM